MLFSALAIIAGCLGLYYGGDLLLRGATAIGQRLGWSAAVIGFVLVSLGTSAPELFVSAGAAIQGYGDMAAGNVVGSNIVNIAIVLGLGALIYPLAINDSIRLLQLPLMLVITVIGFYFLADGFVGRWESAILLIIALGSIVWAMRVDGVPEIELPEDQPDDTAAEATGIARSLVFLVAGVLLLILGAEGLIWGGVGLAEQFGVPEAVVALTVTSIGTGLPEITATVLAVARKDTDMAVGNVVGSNLLNLGFVLGVSGLIAPINSEGVGMLPLCMMLGSSFVLALLAWRPRHIARWMGGSLLAGFAAYAVLLVK